MYREGCHSEQIGKRGDTRTWILVTEGKETDRQMEAGRQQRGLQSGREGGSTQVEMELVGSSGILAGSVGGADGIRERCRDAGVTEQEFWVTLGYMFF